MQLSLDTFFLRFFLSIVCGCLIGLERQWLNRTAGMQTNMLVCAGACLFVLSSFIDGQDANSSSRIAAQVVSGIGFLGGGMIFKEGFTAHGINTAATIWCAAATGVLCAMGSYYGALLATIAIILANTLFRHLDILIFKKRKALDERIIHHYSITILLPENKYNNAVKQKVIDIASKEGINKILSVKTKPSKSEMFQLEVIFMTRHLEFKWVNDITKEIEALDTDFIVDWSLANK